MKHSHAVIIAAIIGAVGAIVAALIIANRAQEIKIDIIDMETREKILGRVFVDTSDIEFHNTADSPATVTLRRGDRFIRAESPGYEPTIIPIANLASDRNIALRPLAVVATLLSDPVLPPGEPLSLAGLSIWPANAITATRGSQSNERIINTTRTIIDAGFVIDNLSILRGRTLILEFSNTDVSTFADDRMVKLEYSDNHIVEPDNISLIFNGFIPAHDTSSGGGIEFNIPENFAGRLNFVFYQATLRDLSIIAWYR